MDITKLVDLRVYLKDKSVIIRSDQINGINYARKRVNVTHPKFKGDVLFDKCFIMVNTGKKDSAKQDIFTQDRVSFVDTKGNEGRGIVFYSPIHASFVIEGIVEGETRYLPLTRVGTILSNDEELVSRLSQERLYA